MASNDNLSGTNPSSTPVTNESETTGEKVVVTFDLKGNPIGPNKNAFKKRSLALGKVILGVTYDSWKQVPDAKKEDLWNTLLQKFVLPTHHKSSVLSQASDQWKTWKKNIRKNYFGQTRQSILRWKDKVPPKEVIPLAAWNQFIEREATHEKLDQRAQNKMNRGKKKDVHLLGSKSYSQVAAEWQERTKGTADEGLEPNRVNMYLHARKDKIGNFHPNVIDQAVKITEIRDNQDVASQNNIDLDALTQVHGKDKRGRVRGVGGKVSRTKLKHNEPIVCELQQVKNDVKTQNEKMDNMQSKVDSMHSQMGTLIDLMQSQAPKQFSFPTGSSETSNPQPTHIPPPDLSSPINQTHNSSVSAFTGPCLIKDVTNKMYIAVGRIEESPPGTTVHGHELQYPEVKVLVENIFPRMENEPLHRQGFVKTIGESKQSYVAWPIYLLTKMV